LVTYGIVIFAYRFKFIGNQKYNKKTYTEFGILKNISYIVYYNFIIMARVNVGINPKYLSDAHLIAESSEITIITGHLRTHKRLQNIPDAFSLGKGHINFFKVRLRYLKRRLQEVNKEMIRRGFFPGTKVDIDEFKYLHDGQCLNDWTPSMTDTMLVRKRIVDRLKNPLKLKKPHRYEKQYIANIHKFCKKLLDSDLYFV